MKRRYRKRIKEKKERRRGREEGLKIKERLERKGETYYSERLRSSKRRISTNQEPEKEKEI